MKDDPRPRFRAPLKLWLRVGLFVALVLTGVVLARTTSLGDLLDRDRLIVLLDQLRGLWWAPLLVVGGHALLAVLGLPSGALMLGGAVFGSLLGSVYNITGLLLGAAASYLMARTLGRGFVVQVAGKRLKRAEQVFRRHGFWPLVQTRFLPLPGPVVNFGAALAGVPLPTFLTASVLGLLPSTFIHTHFMARLLPGSGGSTSRTLAFYGASLVLFNLLIGIPWLVRQRRRKSRYKELLASRRAGR